jgi:parallel beta-helix repeat protein
MKRKPIQNIFTACLIVLGVLVAQANAAVIPVGVNAGGNNTLIQKAIDSAQPGDTILINPGVYQENIKVNKEVKIVTNLDLSGSQFNRTYIIGAVPNDDVINIKSNNVTIDGFYISGGPSGTDLLQAGIQLEGVNNCSLINNALVMNDVGIALNNSQVNSIDNNLIGLGASGIILLGSGENKLSNNIVTTNEQGIILDNSANNTLMNNTASSNGAGIFLNSAQRNMLSKNFIFKNDYGILGTKAENNTVVDNILYMNDVGVYLNQSSNNTFYQNMFSNPMNAVDEGKNIWNSSSAGNSWNNYTGQDSDGNGIGDTPYVINQATGSIDYLPLIKKTFSSSNSKTMERNIVIGS